MTTHDIRLSDLHPAFAYVLNSPAPGLHEYSMDCPLCGLRLSFKAWWQNRPSGGFHGATGMMNPAHDWDKLTIQPSIRFEKGSAHGRKSGCVPHFSITNGRVHLA